MVDMKRKRTRSGEGVLITTEDPVTQMESTIQKGKPLDSELLTFENVRKLLSRVDADKGRFKIDDSRKLPTPQPGVAFFMESNVPGTFERGQLQGKINPERM